ncbi:peptidase inhibitor family I36 protein [Austwickia chelonae]|uniref:peptidase inhibitor family I36 protein n=1 Tax=Austwickia chelonae TaxID=100225 RepID=UPI0038996579
MKRVAAAVAITLGATLGVAVPSFAAYNECPHRAVCFWNDVNFVNGGGGSGFSWRQPGGPLQNISWRNNDRLSSWANRSKTRAAAYRDANGGGWCMNMAPEGKSGWVGEQWNDQVSSWRTNGGCGDYPAR